MTAMPEPWGLLTAGVPLSLLLDLQDPCGPDSVTAYELEEGDTSWVPVPTVAA